MLPWQIALAAGLSAAAVFIVLLIVFYNCFCSSGGNRHGHLGYSHGHVHVHDKPRSQSRLFTGFHMSNKKEPLDSALRHSSRVASVWRMTCPIKPFDWSEHPTLVTKAAEHGWDAFSFTYTCSACPAPVNFWDMCTSCTHRQEHEPESSWEMGRGTEYMQKLWLNPGMLPKKENAIALIQALQAALPLPGPPLGSHFFPQEGYFEVTILAEGCEYNVDASQSSFTENEHVKLISKDFLSGKHLVSELTPTYPNEKFEGNGKQQQTQEMDKSAKQVETGYNLSSNIELSKLSIKEKPLRREMDNLQAVAIGLAAGGLPPFSFPGCDAGSIGFHSSGRVYLNGAVHVEQEAKVPAVKRSWGVVNTTVGCGFDPLSKRVFFTVDGECVYELTTASNEFGNPLYPTVAANYDITLLVNFGQSSFEYALANAHRVSDPCFRQPFSRSMKNGSMNEDSGDLFSMGRIDPQWFTVVGSPGSEELQHRHVLSEAESDLFEIVLDSRG